MAAVEDEAPAERPTDAQEWLVLIPLALMAALLLFLNVALGVSASLLVVGILAMPFGYWLLSLRFGDVEADVPAGSQLFMGHLPVLMDIVTKGKTTAYGMHDWFADKAQTHGGVYLMRLPLWAIGGLGSGGHIWHCTRPDDVEYILKTNFENFIKGPIFRNNMGDLLGDGIFNADGALWSKQRKAASHEFSVVRFRDHMTDVFVRHAEELALHLTERVEQGTGDVVDLQRLFSKFTLQSISEIGFGVPLGCMHDGQVHDVPFEKAFDLATFLSGDRWMRPFWKWQRWLDIGPERELKEACRVINRFSFEVIAQRRALSRDELQGRCDLLSRFIQIQSEKEGEREDDVFLKDIVINFILAGRDTTSNALSWLFTMLAQHPAVEAKLRIEIEAGVGDGGVGYEAVKTGRLPYLHAVITETLRLYPSVPSDPKYCVRDAVLPSGHHIRAGEQICYNPYPMGRMESNWGPDAREFRPDRFLKEGMFDKPSPFLFSAFQAGRRTCLGIDMAYLEMKIAIITLLRKFRFGLRTGLVAYNRSLTLPMRDLRVSVEKLC